MTNSKIIEQKYKSLFENPTGCTPLVVVDYPIKLPYSWREMVEDKAKMLEAQLVATKKHSELGDDFLANLRINFGTGQIAAAFGCELMVLEDSLPACKNHILHDSTDMESVLQKPSMSSYWNEKLLEYQEYFMANKPEELPLQHPDVQSAFNSAHLIRGNDIFLDFFDDPDFTRQLLSKVNDFMKVWITESKRNITKAEDGWFYDAAGYWRGGARISNCSMQMISAEHYREYVREFDFDFMKFLNGGRIHYCGQTPHVIKDFSENPFVHAIEVDVAFHKIHDVCDMVNDETVVKFCDWSIEGSVTDWYEDFMKRDLPQKRNYVINAKADSEEEAKRLLEDLRKKIG